MTAARRRVLDRLRAEAMAARKVPLLVVDADRPQQRAAPMADPGDLVERRRLRLVLMCCPPGARRREVASALALRLVLGVPHRRHRPALPGARSRRWRPG